MTVGTRLFTWFRGTLVGTDSQGNGYYTGKRCDRHGREQRWVLYNGVAEASRVPPEWHSWLHHTSNDVPPPGGTPKYPWQKPHLPNLTGTDAAYRPPGHVLQGGKRDRATGDLEPWRPS